ncbi:MAG: hypothetical protein ABSE70_09375 [Candidatus Limnocylindrales bacterium]
MGRHGGTGRDMEAICLAQIASMVWRAAAPPAEAGFVFGFRLPDGFSTSRDWRMPTAASE